MLAREGAGSLTVWETVARNYFFIFSLLSNFGFSFCSRGRPNTACHCARSHSFVYISTT